MTPGEHGLAITGLGIGVVTAGAVAGLLHRTLQPTREIERYIRDIRITIDGVAANLAATDALGHTRDTAVAIPAVAKRWLESSSP